MNVIIDFNIIRNVRYIPNLKVVNVILCDYSIRGGFMGSMSGRSHFRRPFPMRTSPILSARFRRGGSSKHDARNNDVGRDGEDQRSFAPTSFNTLERPGENGSPILPPFKVLFVTSICQLP